MQEIEVNDVFTAVTERKERFFQALSQAPFDAFITYHPAMIEYVSGFRSMSSVLHGSDLGLIVTSGLGILVVPAGDVAAAQETLDPEFFRVFSYGTFYFTDDRIDVALRRSHSFSTFSEAMKSAGTQLSGWVGLDADNALDLASSQSLYGHRVSGAKSWAEGLRSLKSPAEVKALSRGAELAAAAIVGSVSSPAIGTERDVEKRINRELAMAGALPRVTTVTFGARSALADVSPEDIGLCAGDIVRIDVSGVLDGYWFDIARTYVAGPPTSDQISTYDAVIAGFEAELSRARPGVRASEIFTLAVETVQKAGIADYQRHHCGHGIGMSPYERPLIAQDESWLLEEDMVFAFETPFYKLGWGGMMHEQMVKVTPSGVELLASTDAMARTLQQL